MQTIMLVDDCLELTDIVSSRLSKHYQVLCAANGRQAWHFVTTRRIDCIVLDLEMPIMDGFQFMKRLKKSMYRIPIIITTGKSSHDYAAKCADLGVSGYITKPYTVRDITDRLKSILERDDDSFSHIPLNAAVHPKVRAAVFYVKANYAADIRLTALARKLGISSDHLSAIFRKNMGIPLVKFINKIRLEEAKRLLRTSELSMQQIMDETGFNTEPHFYTTFRRQEGVTPARFRATALSHTKD